MRGYKMRIDTSDSTVEFRGVDMGGKATVVAWNRTDGYLTVRVEGGMRWSGRGQQSYHPTMLYVFKVTTQIATGIALRYIDLDGQKVTETPLRTQPLDLRPTPVPEHEEP